MPSREARLFHDIHGSKGSSSEREFKDQGVRIRDYRGFTNMHRKGTCSNRPSQALGIAVGAPKYLHLKWWKSRGNSSRRASVPI
jgi:hypothetical protein